MGTELQMPYIEQVKPTDTQTMKLKQLKSNLTLVTDNQGREYLFSYETLVAGYDCDAHSDIENGYWYVSESYSNTTTRHIKSYLENLYVSDKTTKLLKSDAEIWQSSIM